MSAFGPSDLLHPFLVEGRELLERAAEDAAALAVTPDDAGGIDSLFRSLHTLKGSTGLFDLPVLTRLLHAAETRLDAARAVGRLEAAESMLASLDLAGLWLDALEGGARPSAALVQRTVQLAESLDGLSQQAGRGLDQRPPGAAESRPDGEAPSQVLVRYRPAADAYFRGEDPVALARSLPGLTRLTLAVDPAMVDAPYDPFQCRLSWEAVCAAPVGAVREAVRWVGDDAQVSLIQPPARATTTLRTLRVEAARLDALATMADELVVAKNALLHEVGRLAEAIEAYGRARETATARAGLERVTGALHAAVNDLRLIEVGSLFARFPRQAREIAEGLGKRVTIEVSGETVSLDKSLVEGLYEPLLHLLRNAIDHGVETPDERRAVAKPDGAVITVSAHAFGEEVVVEVGDDGRGLDPGHLRRLAVARGMMEEAAAERLSDDEAVGLIFAPGFSTADTVSDLSGRGVGMDAVRAAIERLGGRVALNNRPGRGLSVRLSMPAKAVLTKLLVVEAGGERFGAPLEAVMQVQRITQEEVTTVRGHRAYVRRDQVIPLLRLTDLLCLPSAAEGGSFPVLGVVVGGETLGIQIEALGERFAAPLQPLTGLLAGYPGMLGTVTEGDGRILLVLDLAELAS